MPYDLASLAGETVRATSKRGAGHLPLGLWGNHPHPYWNLALLAGKIGLFPSEPLQERVRGGRAWRRDTVQGSGFGVRSRS